MYRVSFRAYGHENIVGQHKTTLELTTEKTLTPRGTCIVGVCAELSLADFDETAKRLAKQPSTQIVLRLRANGLTEEISGTGGSELSYSSNVSMVARKSSFQCERTLMVNADKAASDLDRKFVQTLRDPSTVIDCEVIFLAQ